MTEVVTVDASGTDDPGEVIETVFVEETHYITIPEAIETVTVAAETVTVNASASLSA